MLGEGGISQSYAHALVKTDCKRIEATVRRQRILFAGSVACMAEERLPRRVTLGEKVGGRVILWDRIRIG